MKEALPTYDFIEAEENLQRWYTPQQLSASLKDAAIKIAIASEETMPTYLRNLCQTIANTCDFLDCIKEKGNEP